MAGALHERASRIYQQYGNVMLEVKGMTKAGVERKATCRALFSKLLYLQGRWHLPSLDFVHMPPEGCCSVQQYTWEARGASSGTGG